MFRRWHNQYGEEKNSRSYIDENNYLVNPDQIFLHKQNNKWQAPNGYCFVKPIKSRKKLGVDIEDKKTESEAEFFEKIDNVIDGFTWFHKKMFKLYSKKFQSIRKLSEATKISYKVVCKTVKECKEEIKKKINEK